MVSALPDLKGSVLSGDYAFRKGMHREGKKMCSMEAVAVIAGEPWSDHPVCASPVIATFLRSWNDCLPSDQERQRLLASVVPQVVGTATSDSDDSQRAWMALDWLVRNCAADFLSLTPSLDKHANALRGLPLIDATNVHHISPLIAAADLSAYSVACTFNDSAASRASADKMARTSADLAACSAAFSAARFATCSNVRSAAQSVVDMATYAAARYGAHDALANSVKRIQESAVSLIARMCEVGRAVQS